MKYCVLVVLFCLFAAMLSGIEVITKDGDVSVFSLQDLSKEKLAEYQTLRHKNGEDTVDYWKGVDLLPWLATHKLDNWQSLRFESRDNYIVRLHRAELDTMPGYITLEQNGSKLDSTEVRVIFPDQRERFWIRDVARIYLEDFEVAPRPRQILIADMLNLPLISNPEPFKGISGYRMADLMAKVFFTDIGSVIMVTRVGSRIRLEYPKHLEGSILELDTGGKLNFKSPIIPAGMWLRDVVYIQCGPYAMLRGQDTKLEDIAKILEWKTSPSYRVLEPSTKTYSMEEIRKLRLITSQAELWIGFAD